MKYFICYLLLFFATTSSILAQAPTTFILVRHAEKANDGTGDPSLSREGEERSSNLASLLENQDIDALFSTPYTRTQQTLQPLAGKKSLKIQLYDPSSGEEWLSKLSEDYVGGTVVIVGHSNTIPVLANHLLGAPAFEKFAEDEYWNLLVIVGSKVGNGKLVRLNF